MEAAAVEFKHVTKAFGARRVLDDVSFTVPAGRSVCILGRSGTGKSVALKHIVGLIAPDSGNVRVEGQENVWAIGDCAAVPDPARKGRVVAKNVAAVLGTGRMQPFNYKTLGAVVDMGRNQAVASTLGLKWRGLPAWFLTRGYHLVMMPSAKLKLRLMGDWTTDLLFGPDRVSSPGYSPVTIDGKVGG